jgi:hypothetical protein
MNDRDILRHERFDRFSIFGIENYPDLPVGCEAIVRFANIATFSGNFNGFDSSDSILFLEGTKEVTRQAPRLACRLTR